MCAAALLSHGCLHLSTSSSTPPAAVFRIPLPPYTNHRRPVSSLPTKLTVILPSITTGLWASFWIIHKWSHRAHSLLWLVSLFQNVCEFIRVVACGWCVCVFVCVYVSPSVVSASLGPCGLQHTRLPCPSPFPGVCSNSCPLRQWYYPTISSSVAPFSCS